MSKILKAALPAAAAATASPASIEPGRPGSEPGFKPESASGSKVVDHRVLLAHSEARRLLEAAEARAQGILANAEGRTRQLLEEAREQGFAEGLGSLQSELLATAEARRRVLDEARPQAVQLAVKLAEKILRKHLVNEPAALVPVVEEALRAMQGSGAVTVRLHPSKAPALADRRRRLLEKEPRWSRLDVIADEGLDEDGCILESELGTLDAGVMPQLRALERLLQRAAS